MAKSKDALTTARLAARRADGGQTPWFTRFEARNLQRAGSGMLKSPVPGRTDKIPTTMKAGSYVIPADIVSGLGQGNSDAGNAILSQMFTKSPFGMAPMKPGKVGHAARMKTGKLPKGAKISLKAEGGPVPDVPVVAAGGEYVLEPEQVAQIGNGDIQRGHSVLDEFVKHARKELIKTLKGLPGPAKS